MKKRYVGLAILGGLSIGLGSTVVSASTLNSTGDISYIENKGETPLIDPENPKLPDGIITLPPKPGTSGPLSIDYVSDFKFKEQMISGNDELYYADMTTIANSDGTNPRQIPNYIQISDNRGTNAGWSLSLKQEKQFISAQSKQELSGAELIISNLVSDSKKNNGTNGPLLGPSGKSNKYTITPGQTVLLLNAKKDTGIGSWVTMFGKKGETAESAVSLFVPGETPTALEGYQVDLSWILASEPSN